MKESNGRKLSWKQMDIEERFGFRGGKHTDVNHFFALILASLSIALFYAIIIFGIRDSSIAQMFLDRPSKSIPFLIALLSAWSLFVLLLKSSKIHLQSKAFDLQLLPDSHDFALAPATAPEVLHNLFQFTDNPDHFVLLGRVNRALASLSNIGRVSDVVAMMHAQSQNDEDQMESSYTLLKGFIWGIPVLGFIGTVLGLSMSIGSFGAVLSAANDISELTEHLKSVTAGLSTAFETTLQGLVAALIIQLLMARMRKNEETFLDLCKEYCHRNIISRLKLLNLDEGASDFIGSIKR